MTSRTAAVAFALFAATFGIYAAQRAPGLTWRHNGADGGDLARAAALFSAPHPTGYPTFLLASQPFMRLPIGEPAGRLTLLSAFWTAAALGTLVLVRGAGDGNTALASSALGAAVLGFAPQIWSQALIVEVHGLQLFLTVLLLGAIVRRARNGGTRTLWLAAVALGFGLGNHITILLLMPALALTWRSDSRRALVAGIAVAASVATLLYAVLGLSSRFGTASPWGEFATPQALWAHVSGEMYRGYLFGESLPELVRRLAVLPGLLASEMSVPGAVLAISGVARTWRRERAIAAAFALTFAASTIFAAGYATTDSRAYLLPAFACAAWWIAEGAEAALAGIAALAGNRRRAAFAGATACGILMVAPILWRAPQMDVSQDRAVQAFAAGIWKATPPESIILTESDERTFALWYFTDVLGEGDDRIVVDRDLLAHPPYRTYLASRWKGMLATAENPAEWVALNGKNRGMTIVHADGSIEPWINRETDAKGP